MSLLKYILKEIKLIKAQRIALVLVLIYPLLVLLTLAVSYPSEFSGDKTSFESVRKLNVAIFIPENQPNFDSGLFYDQLSKNPQINFIIVKKSEKVYEAIERGIARVGIIVNPPHVKNKPVEAQIIFDNSSLLSSGIIVLNSKFSLELLSAEKSRSFLTDIWGKLLEIRQRLKQEEQKVGGIVDELDAAEIKLVNLKQTINSIDIKQMKSQLSSFDSYYLDSREKIAGGISEAQGAHSKMDGYKLKLSKARQDLQYYNSVLSQVNSSIILARNVSIEPARSQLDNASSSLSLQIQKISQSISEIDEAILDIDAAKIKLSNAISQLGNADSLLVKTNGVVAGFRQTVDTLDATITEVNVLIDDAVVAKKQTVENLYNTQKLISDMVKTLDELQAYDPSFLTHPISISQKKMYSVTDLSVMTPIGVVLVILLSSLLLTGISVVFDKEQGASFRMVIAGGSKLSWLFGKVVGQMFFALIQSILIIAIGALVFGVTVSGNLLELGLALFIVSLNFVTLGLFITNFTKTQSTTILAALLLIVPMIFLSGILFPFEIMPAGVELFGKMLPLTQAIEVVSTVMVKGLSLAVVWPQMISLLFISGVFFASSYLNPGYLK